jgi:hypothetical protein
LLLVSGSFLLFEIVNTNLFRTCICLAERSVHAENPVIGCCNVCLNSFLSTESENNAAFVSVCVSAPATCFGHPTDQEESR